MDQTAAPEELKERARVRLEGGQDADDGARLELLESLYSELEQELERDLGQTPPSRY